MSKTSKFGFESTTSDVLDGVDLSGKLALVTGASGGLGQETVRALAEHGAHVVMTARDMPKGERAAEAVRASTGNTQVEVMDLELDSLASVRSFAKRFLAKHEALHLLINNAGVMMCPLSQTKDGFELQFGTNHLGHFVLTGHLAPALEKGAPARIVNVSSGGHRRAPVQFDDPNFERSDYDKFVAYGQSKTANALFAVELDRRLSDRGVRAFSIHPGAIITELGRHLEPGDFDQMRARFPGGKMVFKEIPQGAATQCYAATSPDLDGKGGVYLEDCHIAELNDDATRPHGVMSYALDPHNAERLWQLSEELVGERFDF